MVTSLRRTLLMIASAAMAMAPQRALAFSRPIGEVVEEGTLAKGEYRILTFTTDKTSSFEPASERVRFEWERLDTMNWHQCTYVGTVSGLEVERVVENLRTFVNVAGSILGTILIGGPAHFEMGTDATTRETDRWDIYEYEGKHLDGPLRFTMVPSNPPEIEARETNRHVEIRIRDRDRYPEERAVVSYLASIASNDLTRCLGPTPDHDLEYVVAKTIGDKDTVIGKGTESVADELVLRYDMRGSTATRVKITVRDEVRNQSHREIGMTSPRRAERPAGVSVSDAVARLVRKLAKAELDRYAVGFRPRIVRTERLSRADMDGDGEREWVAFVHIDNCWVDDLPVDKKPDGWCGAERVEATLGFIISTASGRPLLVHEWAPRCLGSHRIGDFTGDGRDDIVIRFSPYKAFDGIGLFYRASDRYTFIYAVPEDQIARLQRAPAGGKWSEVAGRHGEAGTRICRALTDLLDGRSPRLTPETIAGIMGLDPSDAR